MAAKRTPATTSAGRTTTAVKPSAAKTAKAASKAAPAKTVAKTTVKAAPAKAASKAATAKTTAKTTTKTTTKAAPATAASKAALAKAATPAPTAKRSSTAKVAPAKSVPAKTATTTATSPATPATPAAIKATTTAPAKTTPAKATPAPARSRSTKAAATTAPPTTVLRVAHTEKPWTAKELREIRAELDAERARALADLEIAESDLQGLMRDAGEGAGDDQADAGASIFGREYEMSLAANSREKLEQVEHALERLDNGTYGVCESCGNPIGKMRVQAAPRATLCLACKTRQEHR